MKVFKLIGIVGLLLVCSTAQAQITYRTVYSAPEEAQNGYLAINYLTVDAGFDNTSGASLWSVGLDAMYPINEKLRIEASALYSLLSLEKNGAPFLFNGGGEFVIGKKKKQKIVPVLLAFSYEKDYNNNKEIQTWESVKLSTDVIREFVVRGGVYIRNSAFEFSENNNTFDITNITHAGIYAGIGYNKKYYMHVQDSDGYKFAYGTFVRPYADVLILPTTVELTPGNRELNESIGFRAGFTWHARPYTKSQNFDRKLGMLGNLYFKFEVGKRPLEGGFITTGLGWTIRKFK